MLTVTGGAAATPDPTRSSTRRRLTRLATPTPTYVDTQATDLVATIDVFTAAVESGDLEAAKASYAAARVPWERIEPIAELFPDLDGAIDFREEDFDGGVDDPEFKGFHRIEKVLWADGTADGLARRSRPTQGQRRRAQDADRRRSRSIRGSWPAAPVSSSTRSPSRR